LASKIKHEIGGKPITTAEEYADSLQQLRVAQRQLHQLPATRVET
jgi:GTP1/Obg family GTP-binding protein